VVRRTMIGLFGSTGGAGRGLGVMTNAGRRPRGGVGARLPPSAALAPGMTRGCGAIGALANLSPVTVITRWRIGSPLMNVVRGTTVVASRRLRYSMAVTLTVSEMFGMRPNVTAFTRRTYVSPPWYHGWYGSPGPSGNHPCAPGCSTEPSTNTTSAGA
jgi:hypothetical protein